MKSSDTGFASMLAAHAGGAPIRQSLEAGYDRAADVADPGIFIAEVPRARALAAAAAIGETHADRPLFGVPFAVKDNIDVAGMPTTAACPAFTYGPSETAPAVERILAAGGILVGKTNLDQFATGLAGMRTPYPVPRNAVDRSLVPGGSSSGSAVAVAQGIVPFALGTDTAGSGRVPAALNGIVGLKPSKGAVSTRGVVPACRSLDCVSIFARTVGDAWRVFAVIAGYDAADARSRPFDIGPPVRPPLVRVGLPDAGSRRFGHPAAEAAFDAAVVVVAGMTAPVGIDLQPFFAAGDLLYDGPWVAERYAAVGAFADAHPSAIHPVTKMLLDRGKGISGAAAFTGLERLAALARATVPVWRAIDVMMVPTIPDVCRPADVAADPLGSNRRLGTYTHFANLLDLCAVSVPGPMRSDGLPAGVTFLAPAGQDALVAAVAAEFHAAASGVANDLTGVTLSGPEGTIPLVVVGAHLSGMALNHELTTRGAIFVKAVATAPRYRLYALPGGPPKRPGMVRVGNGGAAIATEVWALSPAAFGDFVARIPSPLGIGTVVLADGTSAKGFLCEQAALDGAEDITGFGGWRAYVDRR